MRRRTFRGAVAVMALTTAALIGTAGSALACYPSDGRATPVPKNATTCADAKLPGKTLVRSDELPTDVIDFTGGVPDKDKSLTITGIAKGVTITAVVVKGGDGYNVYDAGKLGDLPWKDLISPKNGGRQIPTISHWFVCGTTKTTPPTETTAPTKPSTPATETTKPSAPASSETVAPTSTTAPAAVPAGNESGTGGGLANTGFDNSWLIWVAALLLVAGGGLLALLKFRRKASE
ncbi:LPXTG-motif cell wall-anchored protein [Amycolatopsis lexingtonensis]|uniref:LPXTG-motif cell wall-anchored protein n=1 Tax=Amycolatopsis lexingtonensis TaxID=218822 RepID=A0ABR9ID42_9PSEU|nr:LPXTG cell wall anchor domain-containing protein [Amycolatopsis lexingtonensis]MBE1501093.1 LPXTG-motif cell wall-anchored protein [Amycolatopsis lexingtonensis]